MRKGDWGKIILPVRKCVYTICMTQKASAGVLFLISCIALLFFFIVPFRTNQAKINSPELSFGPLAGNLKHKGKAISASCGYTLHGSADEFFPYEVFACPEVYKDCCYGGQIHGHGISQCGIVCSDPVLTCPNHPSYGQACVSQANSCGDTTTGTYDACGVCTATAPVAAACTYTNACGQTFSGSQCGGKCIPFDSSATTNASCIKKFDVSTNSINPNGSVQFSWNVVNNPGYTSKCGFVDLTSPTPRPIPGLQNLDPSTDRTTIQNIQTTTRFCLVCQFYNLSNILQGTAQSHQWIRVIRIGEN